MVLKPCPFCESEARDRKNGFCDCSDRKCPITEIPIDVWQNRPIEDALRAELADVKADLQANEEALAFAVSMAGKWKAELAACQKERDKHRTALNKYGQHEPRCALVLANGPEKIVCDCGFEQALKPEGGREKGE